MKKNKDIILYILPVLIFAFLKCTKLDNEAYTGHIMFICFVALAAYGYYLKFKGRLTAQKAVTLIIIAGIVLRTGYTAYTYVFDRQHDIGMNDENGVGHWGYLYHIINGHLPPSNEYQFYQPPLFYIISAAVIRLLMLITGVTDWTQFLYMTQFVSCVASCVVLIFMEKIMDSLKINKKFQIAAISLTAFYPAQILTAGRFNNDSLALMFMVLALYFTLRWHQSLKMRYIVGIAFAIGLGMMTKINVAIIAFVTGPLMLYHLFKCIRDRDMSVLKMLIIQFIVFAVICFPCGLWYPIRNYIEFDQPLNYVHELEKTSFVYTGDASWIMRWLRFPLFNFFEVPYMNMMEDTNIIMAIIKTGVHGEFDYENITMLFAGLIDYVHFILLAFTAFAIGFVMIKNRDMDKTQKYSAFWVWILMAVFYIQFNIKYPFLCSADFRYLLLGQIAASLFISYLTEYTSRHKEIKAYKYLTGFTVILCSTFCIMGIMHFC